MNTNISSQNLKKCSDCQQEFPATLEYFYVFNGRSKDGLSYACKSCQKRQAIERYRVKRALFPVKQHGHRKPGYTSPTYYSWCSMKLRCCNPNASDFARYGGRGIKVCARWMNFEAFLEDMGERPDGMTLDRRDVNGHYSCGNCDDCKANEWISNCRWLTKLEQQNNRRNSHFLTVDGKTKTIATWTREVGFPNGLILKRKNAGWSDEDAVRVPPNGRPSITQPRLITAWGRTQSVKAWSKETGLNRSTIVRRINAGISAEDALSIPSTPIVERRNKKLINGLKAEADPPCA